MILGSCQTLSDLKFFVTAYHEEPWQNQIWTTVLRTYMKVLFCCHVWQLVDPLCSHPLLPDSWRHSSMLCQLFPHHFNLVSGSLSSPKALKPMIALLTDYHCKLRLVVSRLLFAHAPIHWVQGTDSTSGYTIPASARSCTGSIPNHGRQDTLRTWDVCLGPHLVNTLWTCPVAVGKEVVKEDGIASASSHIQPDPVHEQPCECEEASGTWNPRQ